MQLFRNIQFMVIFTSICKNKQKKKLIIESTHHVMSTFVIIIILGEIYKNMHLHKNPSLSYKT